MPKGGSSWLSTMLMVVVAIVAVLLVLVSTRKIPISAFDFRPRRPGLIIDYALVPTECESVFVGRVVAVSREKNGIVSLTVAVDQVEQETQPGCLPTGTFKVLLREAHPLVRDLGAIPDRARTFHATGQMADGISDLEVIPEP